MGVEARWIKKLGSRKRKKENKLWSRSKPILYLPVNGLDAPEYGEAYRCVLFDGHIVT